MTSLTSEVRLIQNPALGAGLLWQFFLGYKNISKTNPTFLHAFLVLPVMLNDYSLALLESTQEASGLTSVASKLAKPPSTSRFKNEKIGNLEFKNGAENLFALHDRVKMYRELTLKSLVVGIDASLYQINVKSAYVVPVEREGPKTLLPSAKKMLVASNKLGAMCGAHNLSDTCKFLQVRF